MSLPNECQENFSCQKCKEKGLKKWEERQYGIFNSAVIVLRAFVIVLEGHLGSNQSGSGMRKQ